MKSIVAERMTPEDGAPCMHVLDRQLMEPKSSDKNSEKRYMFSAASAKRCCS